ncbi:MAG: DMT family transporter [Rhodospirillales bacterium]|nr:DMT family transporter [Rhodospirillales bacterium]MBN8897206.1 DMT family transporter [Rhodospirillales bacterium]
MGTTRGLERLAPFGFVLLWSSSFVAARAGLQHLSPLLFVAVRLTGCAVVLVLAMLLLRRPWHALANGRWVHCAMAGVLLNAVGLMAPHVGLTRAPSAQIALVQSLTPLLTAALGVILLHEPLRPRQWAGLLLGLAGVGLVVGHAAFESALRFQGLVLAFVGVLGLVAGTLYFGRFCRGVPLLPSVTAQFLGAAVVSVAATWLLEVPRWDLSDVVIASVAWNTVMVSLGGMALYAAMLARGSAARTSATFYLVPGTVAVLAWAVLGERLTGLSVLGLVTASIGCWLVSGPARPVLRAGK